MHDPTVSKEPRRRAWPAIACRPASLGRYADCWPDRGVCAGRGVFTVGRRGRRAVDAVVDGATEHDARRTIDHVTHLDGSRPSARPWGADRRRHRLRRSGRAGRSGLDITPRRATAQTTELGEDVAFVTPSGKANCMTDSKYSAGALACLVDLTNPPPRPEDAYGEWKGGWIDYDGKLIMVGRVKGDPGGSPQAVGRSCRTVSRWRSATTAAAATRPAWCASTTPTNRRRGSATPGCSRSDA